MRAGPGGGSLEETIDRVNGFLAAGADVAFVEGPTDNRELERVGREVDGPLVYNFVGDMGSSPYVELSSLEEWGFDLVVFPIASTLSAIANVHADLTTFADDPVTAMRRIDDGFNDRPVGSLHEFSGFPEVVDWKRRFLPDDEQDKYKGSLGDDLGHE